MAYIKSTENTTSTVRTTSDGMLAPGSQFTVHYSNKELGGMLAPYSVPNSVQYSFSACHFITDVSNWTGQSSPGSLLAPNGIHQVANRSHHSPRPQGGKTRLKIYTPPNKELGGMLAPYSVHYSVHYSPFCLLCRNQWVDLHQIKFPWVGDDLPIVGFAKGSTSTPLICCGNLLFYNAWHA